MKTEKKVIALNFPVKNGTISNDEVIGVNIHSASFGAPKHEDTAYMSPASYQGFLGKPRTKAGRRKKILSVVRIKNQETGYVIYR